MGRFDDCMQVEGLDQKEKLFFTCVSPLQQQELMELWLFKGKKEGTVSFRYGWPSEHLPFWKHHE